MNAVGVDVSKGKSIVSIIRPFGEVISSPREVDHTSSGINELIRSLSRLEGEVKIVMEYTGRYHEPVAHWFSNAGFYVSVVNPKLIKDFGNNFLRNQKGGRTSKRGSAQLRKILFQVMNVLVKSSPEDDSIYTFFSRKRAEGKPYYVYMAAGANKFMRIYYGRVKEYLSSLPEIK